MEFPIKVYLVAMFATITHRFPSVILAMALILAPATHFVFSAITYPASAAVSGVVPEGEGLATLCGHSSHGPKCIMSCSAGIVAAASVLVIPTRELPRADAAATAVPRHLLAAKARGPPSA
jgi:hypothetical protein